MSGERSIPDAIPVPEFSNLLGQPRPLWMLFMTEFWERFCFYGMRGALTVFMITQLTMPDKEANLRYGAIQAFVYTMTFVGGFFADYFIG